jgi:putative transposase
MEHQLPVAVVCRVLGAPRSSLHARRGRSTGTPRPGPTGSTSDRDLLELIRRVLLVCPFAGEGDRKLRARLRREHGVQVSGKRVLRLLRREGLLAPQRVRGRRKPRPHGGTIILRDPTSAGDADATMAWTRSDGWVWVFACVDHDAAEAWAQVAKVGDRFAALQPVDDAVTDRWGRLGPDVARGLQLRHDRGPQYRSAHFTGSIAGWASATIRRSWASRRPTAAPSDGSAPSRTSACGSSCTTPSRSSAGPWPASSTAAAPHGWFQRHGHQAPKEAYQAAQSASAA